ncbi:MAG: 50S ribosomal protein L11 methyltransferase [Clostridiales bacterium]|nr:50S ribosomal protein L11 methyltransferase [Clostridiales bacterium]
MNYLQVTVCTTTEASDIVSCILIDEGSEGVTVKDSSDFAELLKGGIIWDYIDEGLLTNDKRVYVSGFFDQDKDLTEIYSELEILKQNCEFDAGSLEVTSSVIKSEDWENVWKQYYKPIEIGKVVVVPKWIKRESDGLIEVYIDPGMAFGTGSHETTAMCIKLLNTLDLNGKEVCDLGCGSGILGITSVKLSAKSCIMSDIDSQAVEAATANVALNGVEDKVKVICGDLAAEGKKFDVVIANITADVLIRLSGMVGDLLKEHGVVVLSGVINSRANEVLDAYKNLKLKEKIKDGEWQAFAFER